MDRSILKQKQNRNKGEKNSRKVLLSFLNDYSSNYSKLLQIWNISMETSRLHAISYEVSKTLNDLNPDFNEKTILSFSKSNSQKRRYSCSLPKHKKVWKQKLKVT